MYSARKDSSICHCSAFSGYWAVANGGCLPGFCNSTTFGQVVTQVEKTALVWYGDSTFRINNLINYEFVPVTGAYFGQLLHLVLQM